MHSLICNIKSLDFKISVKPDRSKVRKNAWGKNSHHNSKSESQVSIEECFCVTEREVKKDREKLEPWGSLAGDHCQGPKSKMLWVTNSSHLHFQTSCLGSHGQSWVFTQQGKRTSDHWSEASVPDGHDLRVLRCLPEDKMKS